MPKPIAALLAALALALPATAQAQQTFTNPYTGRSFNNPGSAFLDTVLQNQMNRQMLQGMLPPAGVPQAQPAPAQQAPIQPMPVQGKGQQAPQPQQGVSDDPSFRLTNRGTTTINEIYVSSVRTDDWGEDRLGADVLAPGQSIIIRLPRGDCLNDIRIVFEDDSAQERRRVDTCALTDIAFP